MSAAFVEHRIAFGELDDFKLGERAPEQRRGVQVRGDRRAAGPVVELLRL
jgi:hypothetical protein